MYIKKYRLHLIFVLAFMLRAGSAFIVGEDLFWNRGYESYFQIAKNLTQGYGLYLGDPAYYAFIPPGYPLLLSFAALSSMSFIVIVVLQSLLGAATTLCIFYIGKKFFSYKIGISAALLTALYPYFVLHDPSLHEASLFTFMTALSTVFLIKANNSKKLYLSAVAGICLGLTLLVRSTLFPFVPLAAIWVFINNTAHIKIKFGKPLLIIIFCFFTILPWLIRTHLLIGAPLITSQFGKALWGGNNPHTFSHYPRESMDTSRSKAFIDLDIVEIYLIEHNERLQNQWYTQMAIKYIKTHPWQTFVGFIKKNMAGFSWIFNPQKTPVVQIVYFFSYTPLLLLGLIGMYLNREKIKTQLLIYFHFASFIIITGVFWAHTLHRTYLDIYLMLYAAYTVEHYLTKNKNLLFNKLFSNPQVVYAKHKEPS
ncbi:MAG: glycosyltransferase family 39 protein [Oligoflexia bacterium]|nr:glycosyltransferase family 39 protein [Oligoflexia bacterium]